MSTTSNAKGRWQILASSIIKASKRPRNEATSELIRFPSYGLLSAGQADQEGWLPVRAEGYPGVDLRVRLLPRESSTAEMMGFNNTGNVCVWPAEECLAMYCMEAREDLFKGADVIELGGGMTSLAGLCLAQNLSPNSVTLTDGNERSVQNLKQIISKNAIEARVDASLLRWDSLPGDLEGKFDVVICADCLFFDDSREALSACIMGLLRPKGGVAVVVAPRRGKTLQDFVRICRQDGFEMSVGPTEAYSQRMAKIVSDDLKLDERFDANVHLPLLLEMKKKKKRSEETKVLLPSSNL